MKERKIAYFSMEIALDPGMPTYSGGLGVLAADTVRSAADLRVPMVAVTLLHRRGYFYQRLDPSGRQHEEPARWAVERFLDEQPARVTIAIEGRPVLVRAWRYQVTGEGGYTVPVYFLDTDLAENAEDDRRLTDTLYGGDQRYRLCQEAILGMGGVRLLRALGYEGLERFHMNEGHSALLVVELLDDELRRDGRVSATREDVHAVRTRCIFTTHTPVPAGQDQFPLELVTGVLGERRYLAELQEIFCVDVARRASPSQREAVARLRELVRPGVALNMTYLALSLSRYVNGVAKRHGEISRLMFCGYEIDAITNGVHVATWTASPFQQMYDRHVPGWREDNFNLRYALSIPREEVWEAHAAAKRTLIRYVNRETNAGMDEGVLTLGFARRAAAYKRADLLFTDLDRLRQVARTAGPLQVVYAGKAHPKDEAGKAVIRRIFEARAALKDTIAIAYLENYDLEMGRLVTAGADVWLNTPQPPNEASGTSGMKAALNGVPSLSVLDGWWIEGCIEGVTGWAIGDGRARPDGAADSLRDAASLYDKLEHTVMPAFYRERDRFINVMQHAIALNGSFFNTQRMMQQYVLKAYFGETP